jgi:hypothetical protein
MMRRVILLKKIGSPSRSAPNCDAVEASHRRRPVPRIGESAGYPVSIIAMKNQYFWWENHPKEAIHGSFSIAKLDFHRVLGLFGSPCCMAVMIYHGKSHTIHIGMYAILFIHLNRHRYDAIWRRNMAICRCPKLNPRSLVDLPGFGCMAYPILWWGKLCSSIDFLDLRGTYFWTDP